MSIVPLAFLFLFALELASCDRGDTTPPGRPGHRNAPRPDSRRKGAIKNLAAAEQFGATAGQHLAVASFCPSIRVIVSRHWSPLPAGLRRLCRGLMAAYPCVEHGREYHPARFASPGRARIDRGQLPRADQAPDRIGRQAQVASHLGGRHAATSVHYFFFGMAGGGLNLHVPPLSPCDATCGEPPA